MAVKAATAKIDDAHSPRRERMRLILIEAATRLFAKQGVDATTIDEIVDLAGVAKGTFYNYFTDRADIARAVASGIRHQLNAAVEEINRGIDDPAERVSRGARLFMAMVVRDPVHARMLARMYNGGTEATGGANRHLLGDLKDGLAQERIRVPSAEAALHLIVGVTTVAMRHLLDTGAGEEIARGEGYAREMTVVLLQGLGLKPAEIDRILKRPFSIDGVTLLGHGRFL
ncbi:MAG TPA: helix-turn-helix domain-containing protein [Parvibaculum sp.]|jgi:AcrR family transcriptional regulator